METGNGKKGKGKKALLYAFGIAALGGAAYLGWDYIKKRKIQQRQQFPGDPNDSIIINNILPGATSSNGNNALPAKSSSKGNDNFPLKQGSKGPRVIQLQQALTKLIGSMIDGGGIDGKFGKGTANTLKKAGFPEVVDEPTFNRIINQTGQSLQVTFNPKGIATTLYRAAQARNLNTVIANLRQIRTPLEYAQVNEFYKSIPIVSKTIVTDLLAYAFKLDEESKDLIKKEFLRMGLKLDTTGQWSMQGLALYKDLITIRDTIATDSRNNKITVRKNTILGDEIKVANGMTWFRSVDNTILRVPSQDVKFT